MKTLQISNSTFQIPNPGYWNLLIWNLKSMLNFYAEDDPDLWTTRAKARETF
jgi:hypothetical protein